MTPEQTGRRLPLRVPVAPGEAMDSWLEALARRNQTTVRTLTAAFGWQVPGTRGGVPSGIPDASLRRIEYQAGLPPRRLDDAVLDRYLPLGPVRCGGSRYCPACLAERDGRWLLAWRLPWTFACTIHHILLQDICPACGTVPRARTGAAGLNLPGRCAAPTARHTHCGADLRQAPSHQLASGDPVLAAQHWTSSLLSLAETGEHSAPGCVLADLSIVASWVLRQAPAECFAGFGPDVLAAWQAWRHRPAARQTQPRHFPLANAALTAALAATAMTVLTGGDTDAIDCIRVLLPHGDRRRTRPSGMPSQQWAELSAAVRGRFLRALDPGLGPAERIRYRTGTPMARIPVDPPSLLAARARTIPQMLWPEWAIRLTPARGLLPGPFRSTIAACLLLPGHPAVATSKAITTLHAYRSVFAINAVLRALADSHDDVLTAITCLASYLDDYGSPINYQRRRDLIGTETITISQWRDLCFGSAAHPGEARRHQDAQRYLFQLLTGADLDDPRHPLAFIHSGDRASYHAFADTIPTGLRGALHDHATALLGDLGITEPLTWAPPPDCCAHLALPGPDPGDIDLHAVHRLIITGKFPISDAAARLGTSTDHIRYALERVPRPVPPPPRNAPHLVHQRQQRARALLTREFFEREYLTAGKTLRQIEAETGVPRKFLAETARAHGVTPASASGHTPIDADWLREQYHGQHRSYAAIAADLGVHIATVIRAARRHGIPARPQGVHSRPEILSALPPDIPGDIRRAVDGSLKGWHRLRRFQAAMAFPTIEAAAAYLGAHQSALVHQFRRLERDIGAPLYHRSTPRQPMRPTPRGAALLRDLARPDIQALCCADPGPAPAGPGANPSPRSRDRQASRRLRQHLDEGVRDR